MSDKPLEARLVYTGSWKEKYKPEYVLTKKETTIGRFGNLMEADEPTGDVVLPYDSIDYIGEGHREIGMKKSIRTSRYHAVIVREQDRFIIRDTGSKVGTYVNGVKLGEPQPEPWKMRFCHSEDYYSIREPMIRKRNRGEVMLNDGDVITLGMEMYGNKHEFTFRTG